MAAALAAAVTLPVLLSGVSAAQETVAAAVGLCAAGGAAVAM